MKEHFGKKGSRKFETKIMDRKRWTGNVARLVTGLKPITFRYAGMQGVMRV